MRRNAVSPGFLIFLMTMALLFQACGKKGDPMPPQVKVPTIADLGASSAQEGIVLDWSLGGPAGSVAGFKLLRNEIESGSQACVSCPQEYRPYATVPIADGRLQGGAERKFRYIDGDVRVGSSYHYRIAACDRAGHCGEASNDAAIIHTAR